MARVPNLGKWLARVKDELGAWVYGAAASLRRCRAVRPPGLRGRTVLVLGSEGKGLRPGRHRASCDALVSLPQRGRIGSLNVSTAAAALVYGILHLRTQGLTGDITPA